MLIFKLLFRFFGKSFRFLGRYARFLPLGMTGIFIVSDFIINWISANLPYAFQNLAKTIFSAELIINEKVHLAVAGSVEYGFFDFIHILVSLYVIYALVKFIAKAMVGIAGSQAIVGAYFIAIIVVAIIEISSVKIIDGEFGFIPIWNGIIFLLMNLKPVLIEIFAKGTTTVVTHTINMTANSSINSS